MSRVVLTHASRHSPPCLIFDVRQKKTMKAVIIWPLVLLAGCASPKTHYPTAWHPTPSDVRKVFYKIAIPYNEKFEAHAFSDGFISAYCLGPGALGALIAVPPQYKEASAEEAYRRGFTKGGEAAFLSREMK